jgi:hypothetical protein
MENGPMVSGVFLFSVRLMLCFRTVRTGSYRGAAGEKGRRAGADHVCHPDTTSKCLSQRAVSILCI